MSTSAAMDAGEFRHEPAARPFNSENDCRRPLRRSDLLLLLVFLLRSGVQNNRRLEF